MLNFRWDEANRPNAFDLYLNGVCVGSAEENPYNNGDGFEYGYWFEPEHKEYWYNNSLEEAKLEMEDYAKTYFRRATKWVEKCKLTESETNNG